MSATLAIVLLVCELIGVLLAVDAVLRPRSAQGAIAWSVALISMPLITIPLYLVFGRTRFRGYSEAIREKEEQLDQRMADWYRAMQDVRARPHPVLGPLDVVVGQLTDVPFTRGNRVELLVDAEVTYGAMREAIAAAQSYVFVQFYIVRDDAIGRALREALVDRARAGVRVCFLYDALGSLQLPQRYLETMRRESIEVSAFKTAQGRRNRFQINFRNHRKLLIIDGKTGFIGGLNMGDEYLGYRDTHLRIAGPAVQQMQLTFRKDWFWATREVVAADDEPVLADDPGQAVSVVNTGPADPVPKCSILFSELVASATRRMWISSPYFVPDEVMTRALQSAAQRGVDVRVLVPHEPDHRFVELASLTYYSEMMDCGVSIFRYKERFLHQKVLLVDDQLAAVGTVNLDYRSLYLNFEDTALVADPKFAGEVATMLNEDLRRCEEVERDHFRRQPLHVRVKARVARLASPLL